MCANSKRVNGGEIYEEAPPPRSREEGNIDKRSYLEDYGASRRWTHFPFWRK